MDGQETQITAQAGAPCSDCAQQEMPGGAGSAAPTYVYALGRIEPRFPRLDVEKEFAQVTGRSDTAGLTDRQALHRVISEPANRHLLRQLCWVFSVAGLETYILAPHNPADYDLLAGAIRAAPGPGDLDVVIGVRSRIAGLEMCNGLAVPIVAFDQIYSFDRAAFVKSIPRPDSVDPDKFGPAAEQMFDTLIQMGDNAGATDEARALNYLAVRYPGIYAQAADAFAHNRSATSVEVRPSSVSGVRRIVDVIFSFTDRSTDVVDRYFARVDVTGEFPFLASKLSAYFGH